MEGQGTGSRGIHYVQGRHWALSQSRGGLPGASGALPQGKSWLCGWRNRGVEGSGLGLGIVEKES